jgi:hypothetical protein
MVGRTLRSGGQGGWIYVSRISNGEGIITRKEGPGTGNKLPLVRLFCVRGQCLRGQYPRRALAQSQVIAANEITYLRTCLSNRRSGHKSPDRESSWYNSAEYSSFLARFRVYNPTPDHQHQQPKAYEHHRIFRWLRNRHQDAEQPMSFIVGSGCEVQQMTASPGSVVSR